MFIWVITSQEVVMSQENMHTRAAPLPQRSTPAELVDALNLVFGQQTYGRAVHAKGIVLEGRFLPSPAAASVSTAAHFQQAVPVTVRFSDFAGLPSVFDTDALANPRGLALKFHLPDGSDTDLVTHSFNGFPAASADEFRQFLIALGTSRPGVAAPTPDPGAQCGVSRLVRAPSSMTPQHSGDRERSIDAHVML
jgi:catalase